MGIVHLPTGGGLGDLDIYGGTQAGIYSDQTIGAKSTVRLISSPKQNHPPILYFATYPITQKFSRLVIEGNSIFSFGAHGVTGHRFLIIDDLIIDPISQFTISWYFSDTHFLVRKNSQHLFESLSRIKFSQHPSATAGIKEYDADYYEIGPGFPEPATYSAILGAVGLGLVAWRKKYRKTGHLTRH